MHPHSLSRALTNTAFDGTPVTQFELYIEFDYASPKFALCWAFDDAAAVVFVLEKFPCAVSVEIRLA